ncbi:M15 family metallopeptidase [Paenibacillus sp. FSL W8-0426]|uniref:M15 family metallopeptidase n=1 Tax=Paenibacillus sp. FSL W8-0426 TaxID=2921714 RepID=UPI0030D81A14
MTTSMNRTRKHKSIISAILAGSVIAGAALAAVPFTFGTAAEAASSSFAQFLHDNAPSRTIKTDGNGKATVTNLTSTVVLVNKNRNLPASYEPKDLVVPNIPFSFSGSSPKKQMRKAAATALEKLFAAAKKDGIDIKAVSGYRSYATQKSIFERNASIKGEAVANKTSARPGQSEHQTGLAMDISSASAGYDLQQSFGSTKEGKWLKANAPKYGFIIRYGKDQEKLTGYAYEPWHVRYVGVYIAGEMTKQNLTLEQYLERAK